MKSLFSTGSWVFLCALAAAGTPAGFASAAVGDAAREMPHSDAWKNAKTRQIEKLFASAGTAGVVGLSELRQALDEFSARAGCSVSFELRYVRLLKTTEENAANEWVAKLAGHPNSGVARVFRGQQRLLRLQREPIQMKFTAVDGRKVDLVKLRGKVVLVDFWATWCGPCLKELPRVVAAYEKYHARGFEIVGISLDRAPDRQKLCDFVARHTMPWPQYFNDTGGRHEIADAYGIYSIPTGLLFDREGRLISDDAVGPGLEGRLESLLGP